MILVYQHGTQNYDAAKRISTFLYTNTFYKRLIINLHFNTKQRPVWGRKQILSIVKYSSKKWNQQYLKQVPFVCNSIYSRLTFEHAMPKNPLNISLHHHATFLEKFSNISQDTWLHCFHQKLWKMNPLHLADIFSRFPKTRLSCLGIYWCINHKAIFDQFFIVFCLFMKIIYHRKFHATWSWLSFMKKKSVPLKEKELYS